MSLSVGSILFLFIYTSLQIKHCDAWELPESCNPFNSRSYVVINDNITTTINPTANPTINPTNDPTISPSINPTISPTINPTMNPTTNPTKQPTPIYDIKCCEDINDKWKYDTNDIEGSKCSELHDKDSCLLNAQNRIDRIYLEYCNLNGSIPSEIMYMDQMRFLYLGHNKITGSIPEYFNNYNEFSNLQHFYLDYNNLKGTIPSNLFQFAGLRNINFEHNKNLIFDITKLNMTDSVVFDNKPAINVNFSFISPKLDNDTDESFYIFFEKIRFAEFSMRSSTNNFTFKWQNIDSKTNKYHKLSAMNIFDLFGNNLTGEFPCYFNKRPNNLIFAENFITSSNITCYQTNNDVANFENLLLFQKEAAYKNVNKCYLNYAQWGLYTDHYKYCMFSNYDGSPPSIKGCCDHTPSPTSSPTKTPINTTNQNLQTTQQWLIQHIEYFILILILSFGFIIYLLWRKKRKPRLASAEMTKRNSKTPRTQRKTTNGDKESLLYGDF